MGDFNDNGNSQERDDFWNIEKLIPNKKAKLSPFATSDIARTVKIGELVDNGEKNDTRSDDDRKITFTGANNKENRKVYNYKFDDNNLIAEVKVIKNLDNYDFYDNFRKTALIYYGYKTDKCDFEPFFSYRPQYSQLTQKQKNYYFYWRSLAQRGKFIKSDYSYIELYFFEIINLPDKISPKDGLSKILDVWKFYRKDLPNLDLKFPRYVEDYCLIYGLNCPCEQMGEILYSAIRRSDLKEFYLSDILMESDDSVRAILAYLSDYDWKSGKFVNGNPNNTLETEINNREFYEKNFLGAMGTLLKRVWGDCISSIEKGEMATMIRNAFPGALCTHTVRSRIEISYYPVLRAEELRRGVTSAVRYTENKMRALIGVKSRLAIRDLPDSYKEILDGYFASMLDEEKKRRERAKAPAYEKLYDAPREKLSFDGADEIERLSWDTTLRLVEENEEDEKQEEKNEVSLEEDRNEEIKTVQNEVVGNTYGLDIREIEYINYVLNNVVSDEVNKIISMCEEDSVVEKINESFFDGFGDVILESDGEKYTVIEDYKEEIEEWLSKILK